MRCITNGLQAVNIFLTNSPRGVTLAPSGEVSRKKCRRPVALFSVNTYWHSYKRTHIKNMKTKFYHHTSPPAKPKADKIDYGKSLTVQGQAQTIRQVVERYSNGIPFTVDRLQQWIDDETSMPEINDLVDVQTYKEFLADLQADIDKAKAQAKQAKDKLTEKLKNDPKLKLASDLEDQIQKPPEEA